MTPFDVVFRRERMRRSRPMGVRFFGGASQPSSTTQTTSSQPWSGQVPYLTGGGSQNSGAPLQNGTALSSTGDSGLFGSAAALYENPSDWPQYYPTSTYVPLTDAQQSDIGQIQNYGAAGGNTGINSANSALTGILSPGYTSGMESTYNQTAPATGAIGSGAVLNATNPAFGMSQNYLQNELSGNGLNISQQPGWSQAVNSALMSALPNSAASFIAGGRSDSGLATGAETQAATNAVGNLANQAYLGQEQLQQGAASQAAQNESTGLNATLGAGAQAASNLINQEGNQTKALFTAPSVDAQQLNDLNAAYGASSQQQTNLQNMLNYNVADYNYNQALPFNMLGQYMNYISGTGYGGATTGSGSASNYSNPLANTLAGGTGLLGINALTGTAGGGFGSTALGSLGSGIASLFGSAAADAGVADASGAATSALIDAIPALVAL